MEGERRAGAMVPRLAAALAIAAALAACSRQPTDPLVAVSPDRRVAIAAGVLPDGRLAVRVRHDGNDVIAPSPVGVDLVGDRRGPMTIERTERTRLEHASDGYEDLLFRARERTGGRPVLLRVRAYDQGAAFRLELPPMAGGYRVRSEGTTLRFPSDYACLAVRHTAYSNSHEGDYAPTRASRLQGEALYDLPLSCRTGRGGETLAVTESDVERYPGAYLVKGQQLGIGFRLAPIPERDQDSAIIPADEPLRTPWRVVMIADRPERLIENRLVEQLAPASRIGDGSWVRPGKAAWGWWAGLQASGVPDAGYNNATYRAYIDFAARFGLPYFVIDWGWAARPNGDDALADITHFRPGVDIPALARYAARRGVRLWLWTNWKTLGPHMDRVFALYRRWGIAGIKVDYVYRQDQAAIAFYHRLLATAARHRLMVNIHGSPVPRGLERTYPNLLTQEGVMAAEYNRWSRSVTAGHNVRLAYSRAAVGPMDYTPGGFRNVTPAAFTARDTLPQVMTTRAHQLAMFVVYPSPLQSLADAPSAYIDAAGRLAPGAAFLRQVPASWDETRGIAGEWGRWIAVARRKDSRWFVGVMGDERERTVLLPLDFLPSGRWRVRAFLDGGAPTAVREHSVEVRAGTRLRVGLAPSGGAALVLTPM